MPRYRLVDSIEWSTLHGKRFTVDVSPGLLVLVPAKTGEPLLIIAQAIKPRVAANGQPDGVTPPVTTAAGVAHDASTPE